MFTLIWYIETGVLSIVFFIHFCDIYHQPEAYLEPFQTSKMDCFAKIVNGFRMLIIFTEHPVLDV